MCLKECMHGTGALVLVLLHAVYWLLVGCRVGWVQYIVDHAMDRGARC